MSKYSIRPHHGLCITFFEGKGYSGKFIENMTNIIAELELTNPIITLTDTEDMICNNCPHNKKDGRCETMEQVNTYDNAVLKLCRLEIGQELQWSDFHSQVKEKIIKANKLKEVCGDCMWKNICENKII